MDKESGENLVDKDGNLVKHLQGRDAPKGQVMDVKPADANPLQSHTPLTLTPPTPPPSSSEPPVTTSPATMDIKLPVEAHHTKHQAGTPKAAKPSLTSDQIIKIAAIAIMAIILITIAVYAYTKAK